MLQLRPVTTSPIRAAFSAMKVPSPVEGTFPFSSFIIISVFVHVIGNQILHFVENDGDYSHSMVAGGFEDMS